MKTRLASLFLLLVMVSSTFAGLPFHSGENDCGMTMMEMDCCKAALLQQQTSEVADAKLCCALTCAQSGTTTPPGTVRIIPPPPVRASSSPIFAHALPILSFRFQSIDRLHGPPVQPPSYLRNLALLI